MARNAGRPRRRPDAPSGCGARPANGFTLDLIACLECFGETTRLGDDHPQPARAVAGRTGAGRGGSARGELDRPRGGLRWLFHDDVRPGHQFAAHDHRKFRPEGWVQQGARSWSGCARMRTPRPNDAATGLPVVLGPGSRALRRAHPDPGGRCAGPCGGGGGGGGATPTAAAAIEDKRAELAALSELRHTSNLHLSKAEVAELRAIGDNAGCMALKGANPAYEGDPQPDRWPLNRIWPSRPSRWTIAPERDLVPSCSALAGMSNIFWATVPKKCPRSPCCVAEPTLLPRKSSRAFSEERRDPLAWRRRRRRPSQSRPSPRRCPRRGRRLRRLV